MNIIDEEAINNVLWLSDFCKLHKHCKKCILHDRKNSCILKGLVPAFWVWHTRKGHEGIEK